MKAFATAAIRELLGLFIDDVWYAVAIVAFVIAVGAAVVPGDRSLRGVMLVVGLCATLLVASWRSGRSARNASNVDRLQIEDKKPV